VVNEGDMLPPEDDVVLLAKIVRVTEHYIDHAKLHHPDDLVDYLYLVSEDDFFSSKMK
jgi:hypothetical protein